MAKTWVTSGILVLGMSFIFHTSHALNEASGAVDVLPNFGSGDAQVLIHGDAAEALYKHMNVSDGGFDVKFGEQVMCRKRMPLEDNSDGDFECQIKVGVRGEVRSFVTAADTSEEVVDIVATK